MTGGDDTRHRGSREWTGIFLDYSFFKDTNQMTTTTEKAGTGKKTSKAKAAKPAKEKKPKPISKAEVKERRAKLIDEKLAEFSEARTAFGLSAAEWDTAHATAGAKKKKMEENQAIMNEIGRELDDIYNGRYQPMLPIMDKGTKSTKTKPTEPAHQPLLRTPTKLRITKDNVGTETAPMAKGDEIECTVEDGKVVGVSLATGNKLELDAEDYEVIAWDVAVSSVTDSGKEPWRAVELKTLPGIKGGLLELALQAGLNTIGDVVDLESKGEALDKLPGIGPGKAAKIADAIADYYKTHPEPGAVSGGKTAK